MDSPTGLARDRSREVQPERFRPEVDAVAQRSQGMFLRPRAVGIGEWTEADLLGPLLRRPPTRRARNRSRGDVTTRPGVAAPKYFLCTDLTLYAQEILRRYQHRWSQEVDYWYVKQE